MVPRADAEDESGKPNHANGVERGHDTPALTNPARRVTAETSHLDTR